jgi:hypothetical protein
LLEPLQTFRIPSKVRGQNFERGSSAGRHVRSEIHFAHSAGVNPFLNFVVANRLTDQQAGLSLFDNIGSKANDRGFDEVPCLLMCS